MRYEGEELVAFVHKTMRLIAFKLIGLARVKRALFITDSDGQLAI